MKIIIIILSVALVLLVGASFGQLSFSQGMLSKHSALVENYRSENNAPKSQIESWMYDLSSWAGHTFSMEEYDVTVASETVNTDHFEVFIEEELGMENWMTAPFDSSFEDDGPNLEPWMATSFNTN